MCLYRNFSAAPLPHLYRTSFCHQVWLEQYSRAQAHLATKGEVAAAVEGGAKQAARDVEAAVAPRLEEVCA